MKKRKTGPNQRQFALFPEQMKPNPGEFAQRLWEAGLVSKTARRKRPKKGFPRTIDVRAEIAKAYSVLHNEKGINVTGLMEALKAKEAPSTEKIVGNEAIVSSSDKSAREMQGIRKAVRTIAYFVNRKRAYDATRAEHALGRKDYVRRARQESHLRSISEEAGLQGAGAERVVEKPKVVVEKPARSGVLSRILGVVLRPLSWFRKRR